METSTFPFIDISGFYIVDDEQMKECSKLSKYFGEQLLGMTEDRKHHKLFSCKIDGTWYNFEYFTNPTSRAVLKIRPVTGDATILVSYGSYNKKQMRIFLDALLSGAGNEGVFQRFLSELRERRKLIIERLDKYLEYPENVIKRDKVNIAYSETFYNNRNISLSHERTRPAEKRLSYIGRKQHGFLDDLGYGSNYANLMFTRLFAYRYTKFGAVAIELNLTCFAKPNIIVHAFPDVPVCKLIREMTPARRWDGMPTFSDKDDLIFFLAIHSFVSAFGDATTGFYGLATGEPVAFDWFCSSRYYLQKLVGKLPLVQTFYTN